MSIIKKIKSFFSKMFIPKVIESSETKNKKINSQKKKNVKVHKKIKNHVKKIHRRIKRHAVRVKAKIKHKKSHKKVKPIHKIEEQQKVEEKPTPFPSKWLEKPKKVEEKKEKIVYGIPKHHKHEAELKVAEKSSDIEGEYAKEITNKRVQLKIKEKSTENEMQESSKSRHHFFFFKSNKKPEYQEEEVQKKKEEKKQEKIELKLDPVKRKSIKKILEIIKEKKQKNLIITNLDIVLEIVNQMGSARIDYIADALKTDEKKIQELANILENNNLIEIRYQPFGKADLRKVEAKVVKEE